MTKFQGKQLFSEHEANTIRNLLKQKVHAGRISQKRIRHQLRNKYEFYITDIDESYSGFTPENFNRLISDGKITIDSN